MRTLTLDASSQWTSRLAAPGTIGLFHVDGGGVGTGDLVLDGVLNINGSRAFGPGSTA